MDCYNKLLECKKAIREITDFTPKIGLVLGSGLGSFADSMDVVATVDYHQLPGFPTSTVLGHAGCFVFGYVHGVPIVTMRGRVHYYEGYDMEDVVLPVRLMGLLGAKVIMLTNAAGGINRNFSPGTLMAITDHFSALLPSPLRGKNVDALGVRFPDMSAVYDKALLQFLEESAQENDIPLQKGVYLQAPGPNFETPFEIRVYEQWGVDAVGMSTACEAIAANHMGLKVCGVSCISNSAAGISKNKLTHEEVQETADRVADQFQKLIRTAIRKIGESGIAD